MSQIFVHGIGAVSPAGWGVASLQAALTMGQPLPTQHLPRPGLDQPLSVRMVPQPEPSPAFLAHPRLRRASAITHHTLGAALEALGPAAAQIQSGTLRLGIIFCTMAGGVTYSRRFYEEVLRDPAVASPAIFPETVFNAPASHLAAFLGTNGIGYTIVGDDGAFLQGLAIAADWLLDGSADGVVVVGAEEMDWVASEAMKLFQRDAIHCAGAGAVFLRRETRAGVCAELTRITDSFAFTQNQSRFVAAQKMRAQLPPSKPGDLLCMSLQTNPRAAAAETLAWGDWSGSRLIPKIILGEAFAASAAWQCVAACGAVAVGKCSAANVSVVGANQQAIGARFQAFGETP